MNEQSRMPYIVRGVLALLLGIIVLFWPGLTVEVVAILFAVFILINGLLLVGLSLMKPSGESFGTAFLILGILLVIGGIFGVINPIMTAITLTILIAILAIISGFSDIWVALTVMDSGGIRLLLGLSGALSVILGGIFFIFPLLGAVILVAVYIGVFAIAIGILSIVQGIMTPKAVSMDSE
ncbi:HdeD family acid-resistance protein [Methanocalculus sp. MC3]